MKELVVFALKIPIAHQSHQNVTPQGMNVLNVWLIQIVVGQLLFVILLRMYAEDA